jgi:acylglycerol lipase
MRNTDPERINEIFEDESKFIGEFRCDDYKVIRGYIGGMGDELRLYYTKFDPQQKKASICIIHGFGEH